MWIVVQIEYDVDKSKAKLILLEKNNELVEAIMQKNKAGASMLGDVPSGYKKTAAKGIKQVINFTVISSNEEITPT